MKNIVGILLIPLMLIILSCEGSEGEIGNVGPIGPQGLGGDSDKQIRLNFSLGGNLATDSTSWKLSNYESNHLIKFDKRNYVNVDSIIFACPLNNLDPQNTVEVDLYNITDNISIQNSNIVQGLSNFEFYDSPNIYSNLPGKKLLWESE